MEIVSINAPQGHRHPHALTVAASNIQRTPVFIEGGTVALTLDELHSWQTASTSNDKSPRITALDFVNVVSESLHHIFRHEEIAAPDIRVVPVDIEIALGCPLHAVTNGDSDCTPSHRMAFIIELPSVCEQIGNNTFHMAVGGTWSYNEGCYCCPASEKLQLFAGFVINGTSAVCAFKEGLLNTVKASNAQELKEQVYALLCNYDACAQLRELERMQQHWLCERQVAQLLGKAKLYQCLPIDRKRHYPEFLFTDLQVDGLTKMYAQRMIKLGESSISLWELYQLLLEANKSSIVDHFLQRSANAADFIAGIATALEAGKKHWFIS